MSYFEELLVGEHNYDKAQLLVGIPWVFYNKQSKIHIFIHV
jgi:hypothetical protein